jgi:replicative superfamily II helicase
MVADENKNLSEKEKIRLLEKDLQKERREAREKEKYGKIKNNLYIDPIEAERRLRYFSEDYLNKEFDIFMNLVSDNYINFLYSKIFKLSKKGK